MFAPILTARAAQYAIHAVPEENARPMDMHGRVAEDRATYNISAQLQNELGDGRFDTIPRAYNRALKKSGLSGAERAVLDDLMEETRLHYPPRTETTRAASIIGEACGMSTAHAKQIMIVLHTRNILIQIAPNDPLTNAGATWRINCDPTTWLAVDDPKVVAKKMRGGGSEKTTTPQLRKNNRPGSEKTTGGGSEKQPILETLNTETKEETIKSGSSSAGAHEAIDISLDAKQERLDDQAILDHLAATIPPEPIRYRPLTKTDQTRRNTTSPGDAPEPAFVAWREGFRARYGHEPGRMNDDLRRLLLDLSREYPAVIDKVVRGYFVWTKLDEGKIRAKGLEETLEAECAACAGNPNRTPFPPDAPVPKQSFSAPPPPKRLLKIDPQKRTTNPDGSQRLPPAGWRGTVAPQEIHP